MKKRYCLIVRNDRNGICYCHDLSTGKRESLGIADRSEAERIIDAKNQAFRSSHINIQLARAFLFAADEKLALRTWDEVFEAIIAGKQGATRERWQTAKKEKPFDHIRNKKLIETTSADFLSVLHAGGVSTNMHLRKIHNFALAMDWLLRAIMPKRQWPAIVYREKRAITNAEHRRVIDGERDPEWRAFYELLWHLGGSQTDVATLQGDDTDWDQHVVTFFRAKTGAAVCFHIGPELGLLLKSLPTTGFLMPKIARMREQDRAKQFGRRCRLVGVSGVSLHSYRYSWAIRARQAGYPERFAQEALGHGSKAVHRAYAKTAQVSIPSMEEFEKRQGGAGAA